MSVNSFGLFFKARYNSCKVETVICW